MVQKMPGYFDKLLLWIFSYTGIVPVFLRMCSWPSNYFGHQGVKAPFFLNLEKNIFIKVYDFFLNFIFIFTFLSLFQLQITDSKCINFYHEVKTYNIVFFMFLLFKIPWSVNQKHLIAPSDNSHATIGGFELFLASYLKRNT